MIVNNIANEPTDMDELVYLRQRVAELEQYVAAGTPAALQESEARYRRLTSNLPGMVYQFVMRPDGTIAFPFVNDGCRDIYGLEPEQLQQDAALMVNAIHPDDRPEFDRSAAASARSLQPWRWEGRIVDAAGREKWLQG